MNGAGRRLAQRILSAASGLFPPSMSAWPRAMARELMEIEDDRAALSFAAGCLRAAVGVAIGERLRRARAALFPRTSIRSLPAMEYLSARPRLLGLVSGAAAVALGLAYMRAAGAPDRYLLVNLAALVLGATAWLALGRTGGYGLRGSGTAILALSVPLLLTALLGTPVDGASRWVSVGPLSLQVSLIVVPAMIILFARRPDYAGTVGIVAAAAALALQPDRAMAGVLAAGLLALLIVRPGRLAAVASAASVLAFGRTLIAADTLPAVPYVDRVLYSAFDVHPLAGAAVTIGAAALILPAAAGLRGDRGVFLAFGACWAAVVAAAALGDYPTPLVGYGGSAILGYLLSVSLLPDGARKAGAGTAESRAGAGSGSNATISKPRSASPA